MKFNCLSLAIGLCLLLAAGVDSKAQTARGTLYVRVAVMDSCLLASARRYQEATYSGSGITGNFNMICSLDAPYTMSIMGEDGQLLPTVVVNNDGFGYQYHMIREGEEGYTSEVCDALDEVPKTSKPLPFNDYLSGNGQVNLGTADKVTIRINW